MVTRECDSSIRGPRPNEQREDARADQRGGHAPQAASVFSRPRAEPADDIGPCKAADVSKGVDQPDTRGGGAGAEDARWNRPKRAVSRDNARGRNRESR